jgi:hypothetical protein
MIDKMSGKVAYAVLGYGGFLGTGDDRKSLSTWNFAMSRTKTLQQAEPA